MKYKLLIVDDSKLARMAVIKALNSCYPDWQRVEAGSAVSLADADDPEHSAKAHLGPRVLSERELRLAEQATFELRVRQLLRVWPPNGVIAGAS